MDNSFKFQDNPTPVSSFETIDMSIYTWLTETLDIHATTNDGIKKVPVIWFSRERAFQIKEQHDLRDDNGFLDFPQIELERKSVVLTSANERPLPGIFRKGFDYKNNQFGFWRRVQQNKTSQFANANSQRKYEQQTYKFDNKQTVYEWVYTPYPSYYDVTYEISMKAIYIQQLNEMMAPVQRIIVPYNNSVFMLHYEGFKYEAFMDKNVNFTTNSPDIGETEKIYEAKYTIKVLGFTTTSDVNQQTPNIVYRETPAKVRIQRERTMLDDYNAIGDPDTPIRQ